MSEYKPSELAQKMMRFLDCPCEVFPPMADDDALYDAYMDARDQARYEDFVPVLVKVDETLWECLVMNADDENDPDFDLENVREYRKKLLEETVLPDGGEYLSGLTEKMKKDDLDDGFDWEEVLGELEENEPNDRFTAYWNYQTEKTDEIILAKIPAEKPWEVFAWLPFGGWNECPNAPELMAAAKYWFERFGAALGVITHDELEFIVSDPVGEEDALPLALEQYAFCPDIIEQNAASVNVTTLADSLTKSMVWYFWWD